MFSSPGIRLPNIKFKKSSSPVRDPPASGAPCVVDGAAVRSLEILVQECSNFPEKFAYNSYHSSFPKVQWFGVFLFVRLTESLLYSKIRNFTHACGNLYRKNLKAPNYNYVLDGTNCRIPKKLLICSAELPGSLFCRKYLGKLFTNIIFR